MSNISHNGLAVESTISLGMDDKGRERLVTTRQSAKGLDGGRRADTTGIGAETLTAPIEKRIAELAGMLNAQTEKFDRQTGQRQHAITDPDRRRALQLEMNNLQSGALPMARQRWAQIEAERNAQPGVDEQFREELAKRERIEQRADQIAEEDAAIAAARRRR